MAVRLTITEEKSPSSKYVRTFLQDRIVIGRFRSSDICLPDMTVSIRHAEIRLKGSDYILMDLESLNGSTVNEKPVLPFQQRKLQSGDIIRISSFLIKIELRVAPGPDEARDISIRHARDMLARLSSDKESSSLYRTLVVTDGPCRGLRLILHPDHSRAILGRGTDSDFVLDDRDISRNHLEISREDEGISVRDLGSKNGLYVNNTRVEKAMIKCGESFFVGRSTICLEDPADLVLSSIFEAPEEETSSFELVQRKILPCTSASGDCRTISAETATESSDLFPIEEEQQTQKHMSLPIGPADPLMCDTQSYHGESSLPKTDSSLDIKKTENVIQENTEKEHRVSDLGLIIIGIILLIASTAGLAYLFR